MQLFYKLDKWRDANKDECFTICAIFFRKNTDWCPELSEIGTKLRKA